MPAMRPGPIQDGLVDFTRARPPEKEASWPCVGALDWAINVGMKGHGEANNGN
jgi:hypothetical protein